MTRNIPELKTLQTTELPTTRPAVNEASTQRLAWQRQIADLNDERGLVDAQIESAQRTFASVSKEAANMCQLRVDTARKAEARELEDGRKVLDATEQALRGRQAEIDKMLAGLTAAMGASE